MTKRESTIELKHMRISIKIIKQLRVPKSTAYDVIARYKELGNAKHHPRIDHTCSAHTQNIKAVHERKNPKKSQIVNNPKWPNRSIYCIYSCITCTRV